MTLEYFHTWMRQFKAMHFMAVFDSCFSGAIFTTKSPSDTPTSRPFGLDDRWRHLSNLATKPVRQFISAGGADEELPSQSSFVPAFIEGLRGGASTNRDNYVSGKELGIFLERTVTIKRGGKQNPISGVSRDTNFAFGDLIFQVPNSGFNAIPQSTELVKIPEQSSTSRYKVPILFTNGGEDVWGVNALGRGSLEVSGKSGKIDIDKLQIRHNKKAVADGVFLDYLQVVVACPDSSPGSRVGAWKDGVVSTTVRVNEKVSEGQTIEKESITFAMQFDKEPSQLNECWLVLMIFNGGDSLNSRHGFFPIYSQREIFKLVDLEKKLKGY